MSGSTFAGFNSRPKVYRHWEIVLIGFMVFSMAVLAFSVYLFLKVNTGDIFLVAQSQNVHIESIDRSRVQEVLRSLTARNALFTERKRAPIRIPDPSR